MSRMAALAAMTGRTIRFAAADYFEVAVSVSLMVGLDVDTSRAHHGLHYGAEKDYVQGDRGPSDLSLCAKRVETMENISFQASTLV